ncbi:hypothetical protein RFI_20251 [Reticulomyxa filosa]|uniref:Uncharacterized protein n=1 Tax=Reticulomyxa filosa TaxID=46433 RepID=X6MVE6_RETFI|nr:hypothetical protein RFI_20251 [Reticulomyxa filosa]|eukprot:ETO17080.1 hypothetical protein RFI_20251 [Reticulomyxa filosa]
MQLGALTGQGPSKEKDPLVVPIYLLFFFIFIIRTKEIKCDELRLVAFNNMAAAHSNLNNWEECVESCCQVLKHDDKNVKALFRRAKAYRHLSLHELARTDLIKTQELMGGKDKAVEKELKLLEKDEKSSDRAFFQKMQKAMKKDAELKKRK